MMTLSVTVVSWKDFVSKFCNDELYETLFFPMHAFKDANELQSGIPFSIRVITLKDKKERLLRGTISWVRNKPIKLPGKFIPAGVSIALDKESKDYISDSVVSADSFLQSVNDEEMVGGNYIRVRKDIAEKYHGKRDDSKKTHTREQRKMPRIQIKIAVNLLIKDDLHNLVSRDISLGGMSVETTELFDIGEEVLMIFEDKDMMENEFVIKGHIVRHIRSEDNTARGVGLKFDFESIQQRKKLMSFIVRKS